MSPLLMKYKYGQILKLFKNTSVLSILLVNNNDRLRMAKTARGSGIDTIDFKSLPMEKKVDYIRLIYSMDINLDFDFSTIITHDDFDFASFCAFIELEAEKSRRFNVSNVKPDDALKFILEFADFQENFCKVSYIIMSTMIKNGHDEWRDIAQTVHDITALTARRLEKLSEDIANNIRDTPAVDLLTGTVDRYVYELEEIDDIMLYVKTKLLEGSKFKLGMGMFRDHRRFWICCKTADTNEYILTHINNGMGKNSYSVPYKVSNKDIDVFLKDASSYLRGVIKLGVRKDITEPATFNFK